MHGINNSVESVYPQWAKIINLYKNINVNFDVIDQLLIIYSAFVRYWRKGGGYCETIHKLFADFNKACVSVGTHVVYSIITAFGIPVKLSRVGGL
jgi:hypothetical protein